MLCLCSFDCFDLDFFSGRFGDIGWGGDMTTGGDKPFISVHPDDLKFIFELEKQSFCDLKVVNNTEHHVAFKVKTTSPKKYFVRPNTGVIQPWDSFVIKVTLQAQREYPLDMQCKDKFLLQSTIVPPPANVDELPPDTFNKDSDGKVIQEMKLRVVYMPTSTTQGNLEDEVLLKGSEKSPDANSDLLRRRRYRKTDPGFSLMFAFVVGLVGILVGFLLNLSLSSPSTE
eukprot:XP_006368957.2 vesicle-associated protein 2-1 isoform X2 [Populus trichocarpa]